MAEDVAAAVFLRLAEQWPSLKDRTPVEIRNWLYGTARNFAAKSLNDARRTKETLTQCARIKGTGVPPETDGDEWAMVCREMQNLPAEDQELIALRYSRGLDSVAIGEILGIRAGTVRVRLLRALRRLRTQVGKKG